jgi:hypothetical protein
MQTRSQSSDVDPRWFQIAALGSLLAYGQATIGLGIRVENAAAIFAAGLSTQLVVGVVRGIRFDPLSPWITCLSLTLLLRTDSPVWAALAAVSAMASKFVLRWNGRHFFNPANLGIAAVLLVTDAAWVSAGQWGNAAVFGFAVLCLGSIVVTRAVRADVTAAFLTAYAAMMFARALWLGDPLVIPVHHLQNGALLIFAFFMISDPKTTPCSRAGRLLFAVLVAAGAMYVHFVLFRPNGLIWSLICCAPLVPLIDRLQPGRPYDWQRARKLPAVIESSGATVPASLSVATPSWEFCGFYVAKADTQLFNEASKVVIVRNDDKTVLTMVNDYRGEPQEFAMVVPVPTFIERGQIHVGNQATVDHLDAYSAPRLVEYYDPDPCRREVYEDMMFRQGAAAPRAVGAARDKALGVTVEAEYTVGEYDIVILSAEQSDGLETWLRENGYRIPRGAAQVLGSYIKQGMRFFVAKVNLEEKAKLGGTFLRPLQVAYETPKFMLPIRLGTVNARGPQELFVFVLTRQGRVETTNYRTVRLPSDMDVPLFVKDEFGDFYRDMFAQQVKKEDMRAVFLEYAWNMGWCDPCAADPLSTEELRELGVFWVANGEGMPAMPRGVVMPGAQQVYVTRLHVRYDAAHFPDDLVFQETGDTSNFQGRYVLRHPFKGEITCDAAAGYWKSVRDRQEKEAQTLASLTGWDIADVRNKVDFAPATGPTPAKWWESLWPE